jgi:cytochrome c biogenesis protein CcmG/thiol:disulfide interchange protein DsbE
MVRITNAMVLIAVLVSLLIAAGCSEDAVTDGVPAPGRPAPDFQLEGLDGQTVSLSDLQGRPVMINFWATWCGPCRMEMPFIQEVLNDPEWSEIELVILAVNLGESPAAARQFMEDNGLTFSVILDTEGEVAKRYNVSAIPTTYFVDKNGIIGDVKIGTFRSKAEIDWKLVNLVKEEGS